MRNQWAGTSPARLRLVGLGLGSGDLSGARQVHIPPQLDFNYNIICFIAFLDVFSTKKHVNLAKFKFSPKKRGGGSGSPNFFVFFGNYFFVLKTSKNAMKHITLSSKMKGDVISDHFLMLWFQKDSLDTVGFKTFRTFRGEGVRGS